MPRYIDYATSVVDLDAVKRAGYVGIMRYLSHNSAKVLSPGERDWALRLGLDIGLVFEDRADNALHGANQGKLDGAFAAKQAYGLGYPQGASIWTAVDTDAAWASVSAYIGNFNATVSQWGFHGETYGGYAVVAGAVNARFSVAPWQTTAWSAGKVHPMAVLYQNAYNVSVGGVGADSSEVHGTVPAWRAYMDSPVPPAQPAGDDDMRIIYVPNDTARQKALLKSDGTLGAATTAQGAQAYADAGIPLTPVTAASYDFFKAQSA